MRPPYVLAAYRNHETIKYLDDHRETLAEIAGRYSVSPARFPTEARRI
jgi:hypothetical protein